MEALHDLVRSGKVRYIGASSMWTFQFATLQQVAEKHGWTKFVSMQNHYNLMYREEEREMNKYCNETGVGLIPVSVLHRLTDRSKTCMSNGTPIDSGHPWLVETSHDHCHRLALQRGQMGRSASRGAAWAPTTRTTR